MAGGLRQFEDAVKRGLRAHESIVDGMLKGFDRVTVKCEKCGREFPTERADLAGYFRNGWPTCCGRTAMLSLIKRGAAPADGERA